ncbi:mannose-6-phosphate isomerase [Enterobacter asburiae]|uniref:Phosphohexomutase n=1 Tax=Enterobacter asburiae TaxID=61645 RepID=A0A376F9S9_ENTAS|nr:mannose-6-phosphate isomerase [Enterobacter asburiae]
MRILPSPLHDLSQAETAIAQESAAILFCVEGEATLRKGEQRLVLKPGESAFVAANESPVSVNGTGRLARVFNKL